jgi:hypothetical protein
MEYYEKMPRFDFGKFEIELSTRIWGVAPG